MNRQTKRKLKKKIKLLCERQREGSSKFGVILLSVSKSVGVEDGRSPSFNLESEVGVGGFGLHDPCPHKSHCIGCHVRNPRDGRLVGSTRSVDVDSGQSYSGSYTTKEKQQEWRHPFQTDADNHTLRNVFTHLHTLRLCHHTWTQTNKKTKQIKRPSKVERTWTQITRRHLNRNHVPGMIRIL